MQVIAGAGGGDEFDYDPDWDGDWDIDRSLLDDDDDEELGGGWDGVQVDAEALSVVPASDEEVTELTKDWVQAGEKGRERRTAWGQKCYAATLYRYLSTIYILLVFSFHFWSDNVQRVFQSYHPRAKG